MSFFGGRRQQEPEKPAPPEPAAQTTTARQPVGFETVLGASTNLKGDLNSHGNVRLDGIFEGTMELDGNVLVGETAKITADINARNISIAGAVRGNVNGNKVQILRTGRVWGDINAKAITTEEGAFIDGKITMVSHEAALQGVETPSLPAPGVADERAAVDEPAEAEFEPLPIESMPETADEATIPFDDEAETGTEDALTGIEKTPMGDYYTPVDDDEVFFAETTFDDEEADEPDDEPGADIYDDELGDNLDDEEDEAEDTDEDDELPSDADGAIG